MPRFISPITDIKPLGSVSFFDANTNANKLTYKDELETIANLLTIPVDAGGNLPNIFFSGSASVIYLDQFGTQYAARNPVGEEAGVGNFTNWVNVITYSVGDITIGADGALYMSISDSNQGNDPIDSPAEWEEIRFIGVWDTNITYSIGIVVQTDDGSLWKAVISQSGNNPLSDDGTNWLPAVSGASIPEVITLNSEVITLNAQVTTVISQTGGGTLTALRINELQDASTYTLPLASSVAANQYIEIELPSEFAASQPTVTRSGSDTITWLSGTDTEILFDSGSIALRLYSDGITDWRL
jgi:hypothetical protein